MLFSTSLQKAVAGDQSPMTFPIGRPFILISEPGKKMALGSKFMMTSFNSRLSWFSHARFSDGSQCTRTRGWKKRLNQVNAMTPERTNRLFVVWAEGGYSGNPFLIWVMDILHWVLQVVIRPKEQQKFVLLPKRWVVERTFGYTRFRLGYGLANEASIASTCPFQASIKVSSSQKIKLIAILNCRIWRPIAQTLVHQQEHMFL